MTGIDMALTIRIQLAHAEETYKCIMDIAAWKTFLKNKKIMPDLMGLPLNI